MSDDTLESALEKGYEPGEVEKKWYEFWETEGLFSARDSSEKPAYAIVIPPPNVTGVLHMGHALNNTMQDILCRYRRLRGDNVLWMPGTDHAGIATQNVVEKKLAAEGTNREALGRDQFIEAVWQWREKYGSAIINQLKRLGASCDWERERFTMDEGLSRAVRKVFVELYAAGLIYRGQYIINWCPRCNTALSDLEVEHEETAGRLYHIRYPLMDGSGYLVVATTRPETMLGDTAVAVNPEDERYRNLSTDQVKLPLTGRHIPIIRDNYVDMAFGTGALKVTPAHDPNDFEICSRHNLNIVKVIGDEGRMTAEAGPEYEGLDRYDCRRKVLLHLEEQGLLEKVDEHTHSIGHCYRCKDVVEPNLSRQWFVKAKPLAQEAIAAVEDGRTRILPETWTKTYFEWMYNIRDWCISRQIWWGHQIPAWTCGGCGEVMVAMEAPVACPACQGKDLVQETDVLDTWFSSALWPFSTMGWPDQTRLLKTFYPTSVLVTGFDILFFWVARMMMMGLYFMKDVPFKEVYVHALVRDEYGKKMSKSKGNVIDPLEVIDKYGTDAFRFTLAAFAAMGRDIKLSEARVEGYRHFINKLWNAARFALMHIQSHQEVIPRTRISLADRWILSRLSRAATQTAEALDSYRFNDAAGAMYKFVWHEFCDWYLEAVKPALNGKNGEEAQQAGRAVLWRIFHDTLILLHPFIPFVTEELWHKLPGTEGSIMLASFPEGPGLTDGVAVDSEAEENMNLLMEVITAVRNIRGEMNIAPSLALNVTVQSARDHVRDLIAANGDLVTNLARLGTLAVEPPGERPKSAATALFEGGTIFVSLAGVIDFSQEAKRLEKELDKVARELEVTARKLENREFMGKAPEHVVEKVRAGHQVLLEKQQKLSHNLERINAFIHNS
ncbi:MAG: valine--tRNA ligase [Thermodesulfobacteriota bacterium]